MSKEKGFRFLVVSPVIAARNGRLLKWVHSGTIAATIDYYDTDTNLSYDEENKAWELTSQNIQKQFFLYQISKQFQNT